MSVIRSTNWLSQMRVDIPHLRALESSIVADFDLLAGNIMAGGAGYVVRGFEIPFSGAISAEQLTLLVDGGALVHPNASDNGSLYFVPKGRAPEALSRSNGKVKGSFTANTKNYVSLDLRRSVDLSSMDMVKFLDADTKRETSKVVPTARTLDYQIFVGTQAFAFNPFLLPIAVITTDGNNQAISVKDARPMMFRLGFGGDKLDLPGKYTWGSRISVGSDSFTGGDKGLGSQKAWMDAVMTRLWELGGGEAWYAPTSDRTLKVAYGTPYLSNGSNVELDIAFGRLFWRSIKVLFSNTTAATNTVKDEVENGVLFPDGSCLYVDVDPYTDGAVLTAVVGATRNLGVPNTPGARVPLCWRVGNQIFTRDAPYESGRTVAVATPTSEGTVRLLRAANSVPNPAVLVDSMLASTPFGSTDLIATTNAAKEVLQTASAGDWNVKGTLGVTGSVTTSLIPTASKNLGSSSAKWQSGYFNYISTGSLDVSGTVGTDLLPVPGGTQTLGVWGNPWDSGWFRDTVSAHKILPRNTDSSVGGQAPQDRWSEGHFENLDVYGTAYSDDFLYSGVKTRNVIIPLADFHGDTEPNEVVGAYSLAPWILGVGPVSGLTNLGWEASKDRARLLVPISKYLPTGASLVSVKALYGTAGTGRLSASRMTFKLGIRTVSFTGAFPAVPAITYRPTVLDSDTTSVATITVSPSINFNSSTQEVFLEITSGVRPLSSMVVDSIYSVQITYLDPGPRNH